MLAIGLKERLENAGELNMLETPVVIRVLRGNDEKNSFRK
jgi:hypothetical protein